jgi:hypothetical protein
MHPKTTRRAEKPCPKSHQMSHPRSVPIRILLARIRNKNIEQ